MWIVTTDWTEVYLAEGSDEKAVAYQRKIDWVFPVRHVKRKSTDLPWINRAVKKQIRRRKEVYRKEGRSDLWKMLKRATDELIKKRKKMYMDLKKQQLTASDANQSFFRLVKAFNTPEKAQTFDVRSLQPGKDDQEVADDLAQYFNHISAEFDSLRPGEVPPAKHKILDPIPKHVVASRLKHFRKPKSMVAGDVFPCLVTKFRNFFAMPLADIYNEVA